MDTGIMILDKYKKESDIVITKNVLKMDIRDTNQEILMSEEMND